MFGAARGCLAVMAPLAMHPTNKNELLAWDLSADPAELADLKPEAIRERLFTPTADLPEGVTRLPVKGVHLNKSPMVIGKLKTLTDAQAERYGIDLAQVERHFERLRALPDMSALWPQVYARPARWHAGGCRRGPVRRLRRQCRSAPPDCQPHPHSDDLAGPAALVRRTGTGQ
jgi:exodeoxyribonuclease-1